MAFSPIGQVRLLSNVPFSLDYKHTRYFENSTDQFNYFAAKVTHTYEHYTYMRQHNSIKVGSHIDDLYNCNYVMYRNENFTTKWFYCFIKEKRYINPNTTELILETDVFQTWLFDMELKPSFVAREHRPRWNGDGTPVVNTIEEGLDYGTEYTTVSATQFIPFTDVFFLVIVCQRRMDVNSDKIDPILNGGVQPLTYYVHPFKMDGSVPSITVDGTAQTLSSIKNVLKALYTATTAVNNVAALYITEYIGHSSLDFPLTQFEPVNIQDDTGVNFVTLRVKNKPTYDVKSSFIGKKYANFTPVTESKLMMYPYQVTLLTDLKGNMQEIKNEYIQDDDLVVQTKGSLGTSNKVSYHIAQYLMNENITNGSEIAIQNAVINNNPNDVPIITDLLSAYLQGNRNTLENQKSGILFNQTLGVLGGAAARNPLSVVGAAGQGFLEIQGMLAKQQDIQNTPPQLNSMGGNTAFDYGNDYKGLFVIKKEITEEYRKKLTDYFKMYGYKINEVKTPDLKTREHFNYIQTVDANITGDLSTNDLEALKSIFNSGITLWHTDDIGNYDLVNNEV